MVARCYVCRGKNPRICFPSDQRMLQKWLLVLKCQVWIWIELHQNHHHNHFSLLATFFSWKPWPKTLHTALQRGGLNRDKCWNQIEKQCCSNDRNTKRKGLSRWYRSYQQRWCFFQVQHSSSCCHVSCSGGNYRELQREDIEVNFWFWNRNSWVILWSTPLGWRMHQLKPSSPGLEAPSSESRCTGRQTHSLYWWFQKLQLPPKAKNRNTMTLKKISEFKFSSHSVIISQ